ncbi:hypothetical protein PG997_000412 [Apiospora hydei]|uniref:Fungal N-terminal domain-containing protein n=1 Tax=Apiospora hydei TaxID=1337664 RepID=A0ABR1XAU4_9PEZI
MADPLSLVGGIAAGLQLVMVASEALLATIKLIKDLKDVPGRLATLLNEVTDSISRLCYSCSTGSNLFRHMNSSQMDRLARCAAALHSALQDISSVLVPLVDSEDGTGRVRPSRYFWKRLVSLKIEKELPEKLNRLNRLNIEIVRELGVATLETQITTKGLVAASNFTSRQGLRSIESKMDTLQDDFRDFTRSVQRVHLVTSEVSHQATIAPGDSSASSRVEVSQSSYKPRNNPTSSRIGPGGTESYTQESIEDPRLPPDQAIQILRYLSGGSNAPTTAGLRVISPNGLSSTNLEAVLCGIRTYYTIGNFDASPMVVRTTFWEDTDLAIYLMKVSAGVQRGASQSQTRGFRLLKKSTAEVPGTLYQGEASLIIEALSILSPTNTKTCAYVRDGMLRYLSELARQQLPSTHPFVLVIDTLRKDDNCQDVTLRALTFVAERLRESLGPVHQLSQMATYRLCGLFAAQRAVCRGPKDSR